MAKARLRKEEEIKGILDKLTKSKAVVFATQKGVTVHDMEALRRDLRKEDAELTTIKKTLLKRVMAEKGIQADVSAFDGTVGLAFSYGDEVAAARLVAAFAKQHEGVAIAGGILENSAVSSEIMKALASLPGKQELRAGVVRALQGPLRGFAGVLAGNLRSLVYVLNAIKGSKPSN
ncbi:MAG: 50S ribosomal protein L10 [Candidatus Komeilibacteria bacterium]|nr:50S ribosomal protein L10 [Candidatus Komeilibacteria bacterium]